MGTALGASPARVVPCWEQVLAPALMRGERVLVAAHGNSLRALVKHLDRVSEDEIVELNIPTGVPLVYELADDLAPRGSRYLADPAELERLQKAVAEQGKAKR